MKEKREVCVSREPCENTDQKSAVKCMLECKKTM